MKIGLYTDPHVTRKMGNLQVPWERSVLNTFEEMYSVYKDESVDLVICGGDFFDKSFLEASSVDLVNSVMKIMEKSGILTYILSGNHELDKDGVSVLDYFNSHPLIKTVVRPTTIDKISLLPYNNDVERVIEYLESVNSEYLVTHTDIVGSSLSAGKTISSFGYDPKYFSKFKAVFNGHIHTRSSVGNIINIGSVLNAQHGELRYGEYPQYYVVDLEGEGQVLQYSNKNSLIFSSIIYDQYEEVQNKYGESNLILRVDVDEDQYKRLAEVDNPQVLRQTLRLTIGQSTLDDKKDIVRSVVDLRESLSRYISADTTVPQESKDRILNLALSFLN